MQIAVVYILPLMATFVRESVAEISASSDLNCDFSTQCRWRNSTMDSGQWMTSSRLEVDPNRSIIPMREGDEGLFTYTGGLMGRTMAMLVSEVINCQLGGANLKYWYYQTGPQSELELCIRQPPGNREPNAMKCYDGVSSTHGQQWIFRVIELPPTSQAFELVFRSIYYPPTDVIALDDIVFDAALCEITNEGTNQGAGGTFGALPTEIPTLVDFNGDNAIDLQVDNDNRFPSGSSYDSNWEAAPAFDPAHHPLNFAAPTLERTTTVPPSPRKGPMFTTMCPLVDCDFDDNTFCNYVTSKAEAQNETLREWSITARGILNSVTGIPNDLSQSGSFIFAGGIEVSPQDTYILSTNVPFQLKQSARIDFFVFQAGIRGRLRVCINTVSHCPFTLHGKDIGMDSRKWRNFNVPVDPETHAIHFIVDGLHDNYAIGLDNIQLLNSYGSAAFKC